MDVSGRFGAGTTCGGGRCARRGIGYAGGAKERTWTGAAEYYLFIDVKWTSSAVGVNGLLIELERRLEEDGGGGG